MKESEGRSYSNPGIDGYDVKKTTNGGSNPDGLTREKEMSVDCPKTQTSIVTDNPSLGTIALFSGGGTEEEGHLPCHRFVDQKKYNDKPIPRLAAAEYFFSDSQLRLSQASPKMIAYIIAGGLPDDYRCEMRNLTEAQWWGEGKQEIGIGIFCLCYGLVAIFLYGICCYVLLQKDLFKFTAYKFLFFLSCTDMVGLIPNSILSGIFFIQGAVYCNYPNFIYFWGCVCLGWWGGVCCGGFVLGITRLAEVISSYWHDVLFTGKPLILSFAVVFAYQGYFFFFTKPIFFNSVARTWLFDPLIFPDGRMVQAYTCFALTFNNSAVVSCGLLLYVAFFIVFMYKFHHKITISATSLQMFIQSAYVCLVNLTLGLLYLFFQFFHVPEFLSFVGLIVWQLTSSGNLFLFLFINKTVQQRVLRILGLERLTQKVQADPTTLQTPQRSAQDIPQFQI